MIDALIAGKVYGQPKQMTSKAGKQFATAKVRAAAGEGEALFVNVIAFDPDTVAALLALGDGDSLALAGSLTPKVWTDREGNHRPAVDLVAHQVLASEIPPDRYASILQPEEFKLKAQLKIELLGQPPSVKPCSWSQ